MKPFKKYRILSVLLAALMLMSGIPCLPIAAEDLPSFTEGETVYAPTLTGSGHGIPEGWLAVPETQVPWVNGGASNGWASFRPDNTQNTEINPDCFTYTAKGLAVNIGNGDFSVVFPALTDAKGTPITEFVYHITVSGLGSASSGSFGPITDAEGGVDYKGGTYLMTYSAGNGKYRHYTYTGRSRQNDVTVVTDGNIALLAQVLHRDTDAWLGKIHLVCNINRTYLSELLLQEQNRFQIVFNRFVRSVFQMIHGIFSFTFSIIAFFRIKYKYNRKYLNFAKILCKKEKHRATKLGAINYSKCFFP